MFQSLFYPQWMQVGGWWCIPVSGITRVILNISVYLKSPLPEMRELIKVARNNMEDQGVNFVRATIENNILDEIIAGKKKCTKYRL